MIKKNFKVLIFCIFFSIFFSNIFLLSTNLPVQDDWNNIYLLNKFDGNIIKFFLIQENNHFIFFSRILFFLNDYYLNLNFKITDYISFVLLIFLFFKIYNLIKVKNNYYFLKIYYLFINQYSLIQIMDLNLIFSREIKNLNLLDLIMEITITKILIAFFILWMIYFSLGAFANMTEDKILLNIFKSFKYIIGVISIILLCIYMFY